MKYNVISTRLTGGCLVLVVNVMTVMWPDCLTYDPRGISGGWVGSPWFLHCHIICNAATASRASNPRLEQTQTIKDYHNPYIILSVLVVHRLLFVCSALIRCAMLWYALLL